MKMPSGSVEVGLGYPGTVRGAEVPSSLDCSIQSKPPGPILMQSSVLNIGHCKVKALINKTTEGTRHPTISTQPEFNSYVKINTFFSLARNFAFI